jgi:thymidylate synthase (FAD)
MEVKLLHFSPLLLSVIGARNCYDSFEKSETKQIREFSLENLDESSLAENDKELLKRLINLGHESVIEHTYYTFYINGISRACLQQLVRHRIASYSVESTRYVLKRILKNINSLEDVDKYFVFSPNIDLNLQREKAFERVKLLKELAQKGYKNDDLKYLLPENLKTKVVWSLNARELRHFLKLRLSKKAHWEIRDLAKKILNSLPKSHREVLFYDIV